MGWSTERTGARLRRRPARPRAARDRCERWGGAYRGVAVDRYQYLLLMGACVLITLPLELYFEARVWRRPRRLFLALLPAFALFVVWDLWATNTGTWDFNPRYVTGWLLPFDLPVEEAAFFVTIPICSILAYEAVHRSLAIQARRRAQRDGADEGEGSGTSTGPRAEVGG